MYEATKEVIDYNSAYSVRSFEILKKNFHFLNRKKRTPFVKATSPKYTTLQSFNVPRTTASLHSESSKEKQSQHEMKHCFYHKINDSTCCLVYLLKTNDANQMNHLGKDASFFNGGSARISLCPWIPAISHQYRYWVALPPKAWSNRDFEPQTS